MQLSYQKMESSQLIILLKYWQNQNQVVEGDVPQINLGELVKKTRRTKIPFHCRHSILLYVFYDFGKFDCTQHVDWWNIVTHY